MDECLEKTPVTTQSQNSRTDKNHTIRKHCRPRYTNYRATILQTATMHPDAIYAKLALPPRRLAYQQKSRDKLGF